MIGSARLTQQDKWVVDLFRGASGKYFVEFGAGNGLDGSNTILLESFYDWTGICIEPRIEAFRGLVRNRNCICERTCVADFTGELDFVSSEHCPGYSGVKKTLSPAKKEFWSKGAKEIRVPCRTLESILIYHAAPQNIDYLSIDVEGGELTALQNFPFDRFSFSAITVEGASCDQLLASHGYRKS